MWSYKLAPMRKKAFDKVDIKRFNSPYIRLLLKLLAEGHTITELTNVETKKVQKEEYSWVKKYSDDIVAYIDSDKKFNRIGIPAFFSIKNGFGRPLTPRELRKQLYQVLIKRRDMLTTADIDLILGDVEKQREKSLKTALNVTLKSLLTERQEYFGSQDDEENDGDSVDPKTTDDTNQSNSTGENN